MDFPGDCEFWREIFGVMALNMYHQRKSPIWLGVMVLTMGLGFLFLSMAMRDIQLGTAYAIWTGLGAAGAVLMGILFFHETAGWKRMLFLTCIIAGAVGLKLLD